MKILHITTTLGTGGAERMLLNLVAGGDPSEFQHGVIGLRRGGMLADPLRQAGADVWNCGLQAGHLSLAAALRVRGVLSAFQPDVVQGWMYHGNLAACLVKTMPVRAPVIWGIHHSIDEIKNEKRLTRGLIRLGARTSGWPGKIVYVSRLSHRQHSAIGYSSRQATIIPNGFDSARFRPRPNAGEELRRALGVSPDVVLLGKVAVVRPMKDHANLLQAGALLKAQGLRFHLMLIGQRTTEDNADLMQLIEGAGMRDRVSLLGERHDMPALLAGLDILVVSSAWGEAFPIVLGEAMASGVPCVTTDVGDSAWIVGDTGVVVPPRDPAALAEGIARLVTMNVECRRYLGRRARARVKSNFELSDIIRRYYDLYREIAPREEPIRRTMVA
jgi:glycosyltransferase involved in cell wall biosynthesis